MKTKKKITDNDLIWGIEASRIMGVSRATFFNRFLHGVYGGIRTVKYPKGTKFVMYDVFKVVHPMYISRIKQHHSGMNNGIYVGLPDHYLCDCYCIWARSYLFESHKVHFAILSNSVSYLMSFYSIPKSSKK